MLSMQGLSRLPPLPEFFDTFKGACQYQVINQRIVIVLFLLDDVLVCPLGFFGSLVGVRVDCLHDPVLESERSPQSLLLRCRSWVFRSRSFSPEFKWFTIFSSGSNNVEYCEYRKDNHSYH